MSPGFLAFLMRGGSGVKGRVIENPVSDDTPIIVTPIVACRDFLNTSQSRTAKGALPLLDLVVIIKEILLGILEQR